MGSGFFNTMDAPGTDRTITAPRRGFHIVLVEPEIPPNTGNIGRLCVSTDTRLHLVGKLGFSLDDRSLRRAGLDYWKEVDCRTWDSLETLQVATLTSTPDARFYYLTTKTTKAYWDAEFQDGDYLVFGSETRGLPSNILEASPDQCLTIPMPAPAARSLNLATSAGIVVYEALRQGMKTS